MDEPKTDRTLQRSDRPGLARAVHCREMALIDLRRALFASLRRLFLAVMCSYAIQLHVETQGSFR